MLYLYTNKMGIKLICFSIGKYVSLYGFDLNLYSLIFSP